MIELDKKIQELRDNSSELSLIGSIVEELSHRIIDIDDGLVFFRALLAKLFGENILQHFIEDDSLPGSLVENLDESVRTYASLLQSLGTSNGFLIYHNHTLAELTNLPK